MQQVKIAALCLSNAHNNGSVQLLICNKYVCVYIDMLNLPHFNVRMYACGFCFSNHCTDIFVNCSTFVSPQGREMQQHTSFRELEERTSSLGNHVDSHVPLTLWMLRLNKRHC
jgi:hypothetical protein